MIDGYIYRHRLEFFRSLVRQIFFGIDVSRDDYDRSIEDFFFFFLIWTFRRFGFNLTR